MKAFLPAGACEPLPYGPKWDDSTRCNAFCRKVCLRTFEIKAGASAAELVLSEGNVTHAYDPESYSSGLTKFVVVLPSGDFHGEFKDGDGNEVVPSSVDVIPYDAPQCADHADESSFTFETASPTVSPSVSPTISAGPTETPDRIVRIRSDSNGRYIVVKPGGSSTLRKSPDPVSEIEVTLKPETCVSSLDYYHTNNLDKDCFLMVWEQSNKRRFFAQNNKEWKNGLGTTNGVEVWGDNYWFFEDKECIDSTGDDACVLIINARNGRCLYDNENNVFGASLGNKPDYVSTNAKYRWKLIDVLPERNTCLEGGSNCTASDDCCSFYCHGNGQCAL